MAFVSFFLKCASRNRWDFVLYDFFYLLIQVHFVKFFCSFIRCSGL